MAPVLPPFSWSEIPAFLAIKKEERTKMQGKNLLKIWSMVFIFVSHVAKNQFHLIAHLISG